MTIKRGSRACAERECPVDRVFDNEQVIVIHGQDRFAADLRELGPAMDHYNRWVDMLHARDDALDSPGQGR